MEITSVVDNTYRYDGKVLAKSDFEMAQASFICITPNKIDIDTFTAIVEELLNTQIAAINPYFTITICTITSDKAMNYKGYNKNINGAFELKSTYYINTDDNPGNMTYNPEVQYSNWEESVTQYAQKICEYFGNVGAIVYITKGKSKVYNHQIINQN